MAVFEVMSWRAESTEFEFGTLQKTYVSVDEFFDVMASFFAGVEGFFDAATAFWSEELKDGKYEIWNYDTTKVFFFWLKS